jgi:hypothetical protein
MPKMRVPKNKKEWEWVNISIKNYNILKNTLPESRFLTDDVVIPRFLNNRAARATRKDSKSGIKGVGYNKKLNKWLAYLKVNGKLYSSPVKPCPLLAQIEYQKLCKKHLK